MSHIKIITLTVFFFLLAGIFTWWFVDVCPLYPNLNKKILSTGIAGAKWGLQILAAFILLNNNKWVYIKNIGLVCLAGSVLLLPYAIAATFLNWSEPVFFIVSLLFSVMLMIVLYFRNVKKLSLSNSWFWGWIFCLAIAILLQLTVVFSVIKF